MKQRQHFRLLVGIFHDRFFENDTVSPGGGFQTNIYQVVGFLVATGWFISYFLMPPLLRLSTAEPTQQTAWAIHTLRMFFTSSSFAIVGFASVFEWDMLFPDRRDFLVLGTLPIRLAELLVAKVIALVLLLVVLVASLNVFPVLMMIVLSILSPGLHESGARLVLAQLAATGAASLFALFAVVALQGLLIIFLTPRAFHRLSPWIQMLGMSSMILSLLLYPMYSLLLKTALDTQRMWPWLLPPVWFAGMYDVVLGSANRTFVSLGEHGVWLLGIAMGIALVTWACGYRRQYVRTLESEEAAPQTKALWTPVTRLIRSSEERAIASFSFRTLSRSRKHRLFLSAYVSVGLAFGLLFALAVHSGKLVVSEDGLRAFPFLVVFFVISGFRAVCQFPADLPANWIFRLAEAEWAQVGRRAVRKQALFGGLLPALALLAPVEFLMWDWRVALLHCAFQLVTGALLVEIVFWNFDKVPFTCSYFPGRMNLSLLAGVYLYGFTTYSFHLAQVENFIDTRPGYAALAFITCAGLIGASWYRRGESSKARLDSEERLIQSLDLT